MLAETATKIDTHHCRSARSQRAQGAPADGLGQRRLCRDRHHPAAGRRAAGRDLRPALGRARARRRRRQWQRDVGRGPPRLPGDLDRLCPRPARPGCRAGTRGAAGGHVRGRRRRSAALPGCKFRCGAVHFRRDVCARPGAGRGRAGAGVPRGRADRARQLDTWRIHRPTVQGAGPPCAPAGRGAAAVALGRRDPSPDAVRRTRRVDRGDAADVQLPLPLGCTLYRGLPHLVRTGPQGLRRRCRPTRRRHSRAI